MGSCKKILSSFSLFQLKVRGFLGFSIRLTEFLLRASKNALARVRRWLGGVGQGDFAL